MLGIARFLGVVNGTSVAQFAHSAVVALGIFSFAIATLFIVRQTGIKRLMAYSSVEHIGVIALGLGFGGILGVAGSLYHMLNHSLNKSLMFFGSGNAMRAYGTKEISGIRRVLKVFPVSGTLWLLGAVGIAGAPPFALFLSEFTILRAGIGGRYRWAALIFVLFLIVVFIGFLAHFRAMYFDEAPEQEIQPLPWTIWRTLPMWLAFIPLVVLGLWWPHGLWSIFTDARSLCSAGQSRPCDRLLDRPAMLPSLSCNGLRDRSLHEQGPLRTIETLSRETPFNRGEAAARAHVLLGPCHAI
jgi:hydrogenase-4 component F